MSPRRLSAVALLGAGAYSVARFRKRRALERRRSLAGRHALVTGGSRGLGFLLARELVREGARVTICARDPEELERARNALVEEGGIVEIRTCDVSRRPSVEALVEELERDVGSIDVLVNNAGVITMGPIESMTVEDYEDALGVMFWGVLYPTFAVVPGMMARGGGNVVNITSLGGKVSVPHLSSYCAAKFAALGFSRGLHAELARYGIRVTSVVPGLMRTGSHVNAYFKGAPDEEYRWFGLGASLPFVSMDAEKAARAIVRAVKRGDAEYDLGWSAKLASRLEGVLPGTTVRLAQAAAAVLPHRLPPSRQRNGGGGLAKGSDLETKGHSRLWETLTALGRDATRKYQQHGAGAAKTQRS